MIEIKIFIYIFFCFQYINSKITYVFSQNFIFNVTGKKKIKGTKLKIFESGEYIIKGNCENTNIIINANYVTIYIINSHLNSGLNPLIIVNENIKNSIINLNEAILSSSFDSGIIQIKQNSNIKLNSKFSIIQGGKIIIGQKKNHLKIIGMIGLKDSIKYIKMNAYILEDFIFLCENEKIKFDHIYMEITSDSILNQNKCNFQNSYPFGKDIINKSSQIYDKEKNLNIKSQNIFEKENKNKENNTFYLSYLYFKHFHIAKEKNEEKIVKQLNISFKPKVSVIIPVYNVQNYLKLCLDSIINQKLKEIEIICVNDGSTDNSLLLLKEYSKIDNRIMIISQRNRGLSEARNTGVKFSNGEFIYFIDSDDYLELNALFELYQYAKKYNLDIIYFQSSSFKNKDNKKSDKFISVNNIDYNINEKDIITGIYLYVRLRKNGKYNPAVWRLFLKRKFYVDAKLSFYPGILHEDVLFTLTAFLLAKRTYYINKVYHHYSIREGSIIQTKKNVKNLYGYFISYCEIVKFIGKRKLKKKVKKLINLYLIYIKQLLKKYMKIISKKEKIILYMKLENYQKKILSSILKRKKKLN